jgi:hypothetical protein
VLLESKPCIRVTRHAACIKNAARPQFSYNHVGLPFQPHFLENHSLLADLLLAEM